jgi:hypothetical protein
VLIVCPRSDLAGVGISIKRAFDRYSDIQVRHVARLRKFYDYPTDAEWSERANLIRWADVIHVMEIPVDYGKPTLVHHHGSHYRTNGGPPGICSTLDLELAGAGTWIPSPIDLDSIQSAPRKNAVPTIAHAPTNRALKSTAAFEAAMDRLGDRAQRLIIEGVSNAECLRLKATADIYFDQTAYGYGVNGIEAMALGIPVVAGAQPDTLAEMERRFPIPFYTSSEDTLYYDLLDLVSSQVRRDYWGSMGLEHVRRFHDERVVVKQLEAIYRRLA